MTSLNCFEQNYSPALIYRCLITLTLTFTIPFAVKGQLLNQPEGIGFAHIPKFNPEFILANGITEIRAVMETKKDGDRIRATHREMVYQFNDKGEGALTALLNTRQGDTAITAYQFAGRRLECEVKNDPAGMFSYCYAYDEEGRPTERRYARVAPWRNKTQPEFAAESTKINKETYSHQRYENQLHTTLHNSSGRPYQKEIRYYDDNDYLVRYLRTYVMMSDRHEEHYTYNGHGWLASAEVTHGKHPHRMDYQYDDVGNLLVEERWENEKMVYHKEFVYEGKNMLLRADLLRRENEQILEITTYTYKFE